MKSLAAMLVDESSELAADMTLTIRGGGRSVMAVTSLPCNITAAVAVLLWAEPDEELTTVSVEMTLLTGHRFEQPDTTSIIVTPARPDSLAPGQPRIIPLLLPFNGCVCSFGRHTLWLQVNDLMMEIPLTVTPANPPPAVPEPVW